MDAELLQEIISRNYPSSHQYHLRRRNGHRLVALEQHDTEVAGLDQIGQATNLSWDAYN